MNSETHHHGAFCEAPTDETEEVSVFAQAAGDERLLYGVASIFKVLGDPTRLRILQVLLVEGERCVGEIATDIGMEQSAVSHQLRVLRQARVVDFRKDGKVAWYYLDDNHVVRLLEQGMQHAAHHRR